ncbi:MAG TPA: short-chain dehydrogenase [Rikenellaceae bacterium]|nr:short-chain dehydrogenase [Rikenellaceae bacterium]
MNLKGKTVLITGGASGIGKIMGSICLEKGVANLVIWDVNPDNIRRTEIELSGIPGSGANRTDANNADSPQTLGSGNKDRIHSYQVNCADADAVAETYSKVINEVGQVDVLINCAGVIRGNNTFDKQTVKDINLTMDINATAPMLVALQVLPDMIKRNSGCICTIASAAGMLGVPKMSVYCASKWAVIGWTESMRIELKLAKSKVKVMSVAPYFINTGMFDGVQSKIFPILKPDAVARKVIKAIEKGKSFKGIPFPYHFIRFWQGILPLAVFDFIFGKCFGVYSVMDHFTGRRNIQKEALNIKGKSLSLRRDIHKAS